MPNTKKQQTNKRTIEKRSFVKEVWYILSLYLGMLSWNAILLISLYIKLSLVQKMTIFWVSTKVLLRVYDRRIKYESLFSYQFQPFIKLFVKVVASKYTRRHFFCSMYALLFIQPCSHRQLNWLQNSFLIICNDCR